MKLFIALIITSFTYIFAGVVGHVDKVLGNAKIQKKDTVFKKGLRNGMSLEVGDLVMTYNESYVRIVLEDNSTLIVDADSLLSFTQESVVSQSQGKVYYKITSKKATQPMQVRTDFAIIGIKGTTFIVKSDDEKALLLQEGRVGISSIEKEFMLYRKKVQAEFEAYKAKEDKAFEEYKNAMDAYEKPQKSAAFDLEEQNTLSFDDNVVKESAFTQDHNEEFLYFEKLFAKE